MALDVRIGTVLADRYEVVEHLGRGGMGTVVQVHDRATDTARALKLLPRVDDTLRRRLLREGRLQGAVDHPGVVPVTEVIDVDGHPGLVLELVPGGRTLADRLAEGHVPEAEADRLAEALFEAVAAAHAHGLVHRDLKPANVLLHDGRPRVADFGLAKMLGDLGSLATATGALLGTPSYMAPEQVQDARRVDARADLFSLGAVLYELLTGQRAFPGAPTEAMWKAAHAEFAPPPPGARGDAVTWALRPDPADRPASVEELRAAWRGERAPPAGPDPSTLRDCPPFDELLAQREAPAMADHVASCIRCRVELRLYDDAFTPPPAPRAPVGRWVLGFGAGLLGALATTAAVVGSLDGLAMVGPFLLLLLALPAVTGARLAHSLTRARQGVGSSLLGWFLGPGLVLAIGAVATALGADRAIAAIALAQSRDGTPELLARLAAQGAHVALSTWTIGYAIGLATMVLPPVALVLQARDDARDGGFDQLPVIVALVGAALLWLGEGGTPAGLLAFAATTVVGVLLALLPRRAPADTRGVVALGAAVLVATTPAAARVEVLRRAVVEGPVHEVWIRVVDGWSIAWAVLAVVLAATALRPRGDEPWPRPTWSVVTQLLVLGAVAGGPTAWTVARMQVLGARLLEAAP